MAARKAKGERRAHAYIRVSTLSQADHGQSLPAQEERIRTWCEANGYVLAGIHVDRGLSGGRFDRPGLQEALAAVQRGDALVVNSLSRLARSTRDTLAIAEDLEYKGADLVSLSEKIDTTSAAGRMVFRLLAVLSEFERDVVAERTSMALRHMKACGKFTGGNAPYGHRLLASGDLEPVPEEQAVIQRIHELHAEDRSRSLRKVAAALDREGCRTRADRPWHSEQIRRVLANAPSAVALDASA